MENREFVQAFKQRGISAFENNEPFEAYIYLWLAFLQSCAPDRMKAIKSDGILETLKEFMNYSGTQVLNLIYFGCQKETMVIFLTLWEEMNET